MYRAALTASGSYNTPSPENSKFQNSWSTGPRIWGLTPATCAKPSTIASSSDSSKEGWLPGLFAVDSCLNRHRITSSSNCGLFNRNSIRVLKSPGGNEKISCMLERAVLQSLSNTSGVMMSFRVPTSSPPDCNTRSTCRFSLSNAMPSQTAKDVVPQSASGHSAWCEKSLICHRSVWSTERLNDSSHLGERLSSLESMVRATIFSTSWPSTDRTLMMTTQKCRSIPGRNRTLPIEASTTTILYFISKYRAAVHK
mmetsp:Transcript_57663/g.153634  ORF Transcript_57663/g.153634 Transcript_57663/m.153634 type:complete len:254 (-) Transcript_57663:18-779(-)